MNLPLQGQSKSMVSIAGVLAGRIKGAMDEEMTNKLKAAKLVEKTRKDEAKKAESEAKKIEADINKTKMRAEAEAQKRRAEIEKSREFAKMITEGVYTTSFDPSTYTPPKKKE